MTVDRSRQALRHAQRLVAVARQRIEQSKLCILTRGQVPANAELPSPALTNLDEWREDAEAEVAVSRAS